MNNSIRNSIFGSLGLESNSASDQYDVVPDPVAPEELVASDVNVNRALFDATQCIDEIDDIRASMESLREARRTIQNSKNFTSTDYQLLKVSIEHACGRWIPTHLVAPSFESFDENNEEALALAMEGIGEVVNALGAAVKKMSSNVLKSVNKFFKDMENVHKHNLREIPLLKKRIAAAVPAENPRSGPISPTGYKHLYTPTDYGKDALLKALPSSIRFCSTLEELDVSKAKSGIRKYFDAVNKVLQDNDLEQTSILSEAARGVVDALTGNIKEDMDLKYYRSYFSRIDHEPLAVLMGGNLVIKAYPRTSTLEDIPFLAEASYDNVFKAQLKNLEPANLKECKAITKLTVELYDRYHSAWTHMSAYSRMLDSLYEEINQCSTKLFRKIEVEVDVDFENQSVEVRKTDFAEKYTEMLVWMISSILRDLMGLARGTAYNVRRSIAFVNASLDMVAEK